MLRLDPPLIPRGIRPRVIFRRSKAHPTEENLQRTYGGQLAQRCVIDGPRRLARRIAAVASGGQGVDGRVGNLKNGTTQTK